MTSADNTVDLEQILPQAALDAVPQPMWIYGFDGVAAGFNVAAETFWRLPREHIIGKFNVFDYVATPGGASFRGMVRALRAALAEGTVQVCEPILIDLGAIDVTADLSSQRAYIENTVFPLRDRAGVIRFAVLLQRNVTELVEKRRAVDEAMAKIAAQDELIAALEAAQRAIEEQRRTIEELSTPIIQVWEGVLTLPVIGQVDERRATEMMHKLLQEIAQTKAEFAILDLTGVHSVDAATAEHLGRILRAVALLGARGIMSGVSPTVASALTSTAIDMSNFEMCRDLSAALLLTMRMREQARARIPLRSARF
jgi:anti-anti-sigma regulatory factor